MADCLRWKRFAAFTDWLAPTKVFKWNNWNGNVKTQNVFQQKITVELTQLWDFSTSNNLQLSSTDCLSLCTLEYFGWLSWWVAVMAVNQITHTYSTHLSETCWSSCSAHHVTITFHVICYLTIITRFVHTCPYKNARLLQSC